jgi:Caudovirales tail fibre assembly protein, lambda gpK
LAAPRGAAEMEAENQKRTSAAVSSWGEYVSAIDAAAQAGSQTAQTFSTLLHKTGIAMSQTVDAAAILQKAQAEVALQPARQRTKQAEDQLKQLQDQYRLGGAATPEEKAQIQAELTYRDLIKEGVRSDLAHQIANQELANAMQDLAKSVDQNTTALQDQLDPIYSEGRAALRIGYYGEGAGGTMRTVTGTGFAANMNTPAPTTPAPAPTVTVVNNFPPGAVMGDRRTQYLAANSYGRAIKAIG